MGYLTSPYRISHWSSIEITALNCLLLEKIALLCTRFRRQTDEQTNRQTGGHHHRVKPPLALHAACYFGYPKYLFRISKITISDIRKYLKYQKLLFWISEIVISDIWNSFLDI